MTPPLFSPYETRIELQCRGGLLALPETFWRESAYLCGARVVSEYKDVGVRSYILSLSSLFVFDTRVILICCSQKPFDQMLTFWRDVVGECSPYGLFIETRCNPFEENKEAGGSNSGRLSLKTVADFGFQIQEGKPKGYYPSRRSRYPTTMLSENRKCLTYASWGNIGIERPPSHKVAMMFSPTSSLDYSLIKECISKVSPRGIHQEFHFTPSGFSSNHLHFVGDTVCGYSTVHYSEELYVSIECCSFDREVWCERELFDSLVRTITTKVLPKDVIVVPEWSMREEVGERVLHHPAEL